jgi:hypothetical protein
MCQGLDEVENGPAVHTERAQKSSAGSVTSPYRRNRLWGSPSLLSNGSRGLFPGTAIRQQVTEILYVRATCPAHLILPDFIILHCHWLNS